MNVNSGYIYLNSCHCNAFVLINVRLFKKMFVPLQPETAWYFHGQLDTKIHINI